MFVALSSCGYDLCTAAEIMSVADAMSTNGMKELGYEYINLDGNVTYSTYCVKTGMLERVQDIVLLYT